MCESGLDGLLGELTVVVCFSFGRRDVPERLHESVMVEPGYPFQGGQFYRLPSFPGTAPVDQFGLVQPVDGLCQSVVIAVAFAADRGLDASLGSRSVYRIDTYCEPLSLWWVRRPPPSGRWS